MANEGYDKDREGERAYHPHNPDPLDNSKAGDASDPRWPLRNAEEQGGPGTDRSEDGRSNGDSKAWDPSRIKDKEEFAKANPSGDSDNQVGSGYTPKDRQSGKGIFSKLKRRRRRVALVAAGVGAVASLVGSIFFGLSGFGLHNFMANLERTTFARYQVDMRGRSSKWLQAYIELRLGEVEDKNLAPKDRANVLFRADRVDTNRPLTDWYRTLRASKFEQDVFEKRGIKFSTFAYQDGNIIKYRPALVTFVNTGEQLTFDPGQKAFDAIAKGDVNAFNGELEKFVRIKVYDGDKAGRVAIKTLLNEEYPQWWKAIKRFHLRHDIQNMIGVRSWTFFEKTRQTATEKKISIRNKIITNALPEDSKSGKLIKCLFGIDNCTATTDPANPKARAYTHDGTHKSGDKTGDADGNPKTPDIPLGDGTGDASIQAGADGVAGEGVRKAIVSKLFGAAGILSMLDSLSRFSESLHNHSFSKLVVNAKGGMAVGLLTTFMVADDQSKTGELNSGEFNTFMQDFANPTNSEGWTTVVSPSSSTGKVSAATTEFVQAKDKQNFCSAKHQAEISLPQNKQAADQEFQWNCPKDQVGSANQFGEFEDAWNNGPGAILNPILQAYHAAVGGIVGVFNDLTGFITGPLISGALSVLGLTDDVKEVGAYVADQAMAFGGATPPVDEQSPSGKVGNILLQGGSVLAESTMREQGGASTTATTAALATKNYVAYETEQEHSSISNRYLALSNPQSLLSRQLFAISTMSLSNFSQTAMTVFASAFSSPLRTLSLPAHAATSDPGPYAAAKFAGIDNNTYDLPAECLNANPLDMTPQSATNADDLGIFKPDELTWELLSNKETFYDALYQKVDDNEDLAKKVWNCALTDNTVRGGIGAPYGYKGEDAYQDSSGSAPESTTPADTSTGSAVSGDSQQLAKQLIDSGKLTDQDGRYIAQIKAVSKGDFSCNVNPSILKMLAGVVVQDGHKVVISSLNRKCTGVLTASGTGSFHYKEGGGHAVDVVGFDDGVVDGSSASSIKYVQEAIKYLPDNSGIGQVSSCGAGFKLPSSFYVVPDTCNHVHIQVPVMQLKP